MLAKRIRRSTSVFVGAAISLFAVSNVAAAEATPPVDSGLALMMPTLIILALIGDMVVLLLRQPDDSSWES